MMKFTHLIALVILFNPHSVSANGKLSEHLISTLAAPSSTDRTLVWIFFADKGRYETNKSEVPFSVVSERSLMRRRKVRSENALVDYSDLQIEAGYVDALNASGMRIKQRSRWFNCVSVYATRNHIDQLESFPFVARIDLVARFRRDHSEEQIQSALPQRSPDLTQNSSSRIDSLLYGPSFDQLNLINIPAIHNAGNYGQGVLVGSFDNGFRLLNHETFDSLRPRIVATYDFVDHKISVAPNNPDPGFGAHGILTLSALGGYTPGQLIGPAFGASYVLARTENDSSETPIEEDNWLAAMEWADSIGVDVTTTSLGYLTYDPPYSSWTWENMDGNTTLVTRASDMAVARGIVVCNSAGNNGFNPSHNTLNAPADGDSVLSIGASNPDGTRAGFSSVGPTLSSPPRIKPDIMAQGSSVRCASPTDPTLYTYASGTSLSCPLAAGAVALILHAHPNATPLQVANVLRQTASQSGTPDNLNGWGLINTVAAISLMTGVDEATPTPESFSLLQNYPNPFNPTTTINLIVPEQSQVTLKIYDLFGRDIRTLLNEHRSMGQLNVVWDGKNNTGQNVASGVYFYRVKALTGSGRSFVGTKKLTLLR